MANKRTPNKNIITKYGGYKKTKKIEIKFTRKLKIASVCIMRLSDKRFLKMSI